jgi:hypothetical protein
MTLIGIQLSNNMYFTAAGNFTCITTNDKQLTTGKNGTGTLMSFKGHFSSFDSTLPARLVGI